MNKKNAVKMRLNELTIKLDQQILLSRKRPHSTSC